MASLNCPLHPRVMLTDCLAVTVRVERIGEARIQQLLNAADTDLELDADEDVRASFMRSLDEDTDEDVVVADEDDELRVVSSKKRKVKLSNLLGKNKRNNNAMCVDMDDDDENNEKEARTVPQTVLKPVATEKSEYEKLRERNISERMALFNKHFKEDLSILRRSIELSNNNNNAKNGLKKRNYVFKRKKLLEPSRRSKRLSLTPLKNRDENEQEFDCSSDDEDDKSFVPRVRRSYPHRWHFNPNDSVLTPDQITQAMIDNVARRVSDKVYSQTKGTTCHQCRQKTIDTKTICRSGFCAGGRGMFCGVCLPNRYGERVEAALKDPNWMCPPCKDICNCSICRNRLGKGATGPITYLAQARGFLSVKDYLEHLCQKHGRENFDEDEEDQKFVVKVENDMDDEDKEN